MEFDITQLDKTLLIQTLFLHSNPIGLGKIEHGIRRRFNDNVDGLSVEECQEFLVQFDNDNSTSKTFFIVDYCKGKPIKINFYRNKNGRVIVDSGSYDSRNGKYRFLEAMLNIFSIDEILITKKGYRLFVISDIPNDLVRPKEQEKKFKEIIMTSTLHENAYGKHWVIDETKVSYKSPLSI